MKLIRARGLAAASTALAVFMTASMPQASAQNLFEMLFRNNNRQRQVEPPPEPPPVVRAAPPRVAGPSYYTYKTDPLVKVDFAAIRPDRSDDAAMVEPFGLDASSVASTEPDEASPVQVAQIVHGEVTTDAAPEEPAAPASEVVTAPAAAGIEVGLSEAPVEEAAVPEADTTVTSTETPAPAAVEQSAVETAPVDGAPPAAEQAETTAPAEEPAEEVVAAPVQLSDEQIASLQEFELLAEKDAAEAIVAHYTAAPEFIWVGDAAPNERARAALRTLADASSHGLDPRDYAVTVPTGTSQADLARFEMELSARMLRYVRDARSGRIDPNRISGYHDFEPKPLDQVATLQGARTSEDVAAFLEAQHPQNARYRSLRVELEALRASAENEIVIAPKTLIKPGQTSAELPKVLSLIARKADEVFRAEHGEVLTRNLGSEVYAQELVAVVKAAQRANGLGDDGVIGPRTVQALAGESRAGRIEKVEVALEQLRWLPSDFGDRHVFINAPAFNATYVEGGREALSMRTVVGGLGTQTYFFQDEIDYVEFHPYWGVPKSILVNKYLPKLYSDPSYLDRTGFEVVNSKGQRVSSSSVDWGAYGANVPFDVRQKPGGGNALGELKIMFPNRHAIYMHDTPDKHLFDRDNRALSNGCIRLQDPRAMAAAVLGWSRAQVDERIAQPHGRAELSTKVPVYVTYFTAWPNEAGEVAYFNDVYSRDEKVKAAIAKVEALRAPGA